MITYIEVDGFKSLSKFKLQLKKGLNILVGPNGAGKTNILLFFEFLSKSMTNDVGATISAMGGAGTIFQKIGENEYNDSIKCKIIGCVKIKSDKYVVFEYSFEIKNSFQKDTLYYCFQKIRLSPTANFIENYYECAIPFEWDIDIHVDSPEDKEASIDVKNGIALLEKIKSILKSGSGEALNEYINNQRPKYNSLLNCLQFIIPYSDSILFDLQGGEAFNLDPNKIRELEDASSPAKIGRDGSGLATTLYALKKSKNLNGSLHHQSNNQIFNNVFDQIINFFKLANTTIADLDIDKNSFNNKINIKIYIKSGDYQAVLPLSAMSDGTIKWLTLVTLIFASETVFSIEEPENFLHPWMQAEIVTITREHLENNNSYVIMTTHSESLLNFAKSDEIILVDLSNGHTIADRIKNQDVINESIANSGWRLGHFYFSNSLVND